jgi:hypothetical protein
MDASQLIAFLNALNVGELDSIRGKLTQAEAACHEIGQENLAEMLHEANAALASADLKTYRKRVETVIARLGHLR